MSSKKKTRKAARPARRPSRPAARAAAKKRRSPKPKAAARKAAPWRKTAKKRAPAARRAASPRALPGGIGLTHHHMDYTSHDVAAMSRFWSETLGFTNVTVTPSGGYLTVELTPYSSMGFMPPLSGPPESWRPPGEPAIYLYVNDVDRAYAELTARGAEFDGPPEDMPWGYRVAKLRDPEGRRICLAKKLKT